MVTLCFSPPQAILGGEKRYDDHQRQALAAALRHPLNLVDAALAGAGVVAAGFPALELVPGRPALNGPRPGTVPGALGFREAT
jgi:hypothetical protein